uniref:Secreted protein n=1 Tax=Heligmosomoides polygyrus TaxID=6339 RepID=A0A183GFM2_HELPZ
LSAFGKMPSRTTSMRNTTASRTISTIVLRELRACRPSRDTCLPKLSSLYVSVKQHERQVTTS